MNNIIHIDFQKKTRATVCGTGVDCVVQRDHSMDSINYATADPWGYWNEVLKQVKDYGNEI